MEAKFQRESEQIFGIKEEQWNAGVAVAVMIQMALLCSIGGEVSFGVLRAADLCFYVLYVLELLLKSISYADCCMYEPDSKPGTELSRVSSGPDGDRDGDQVEAELSRVPSVWDGDELDEAIDLDEDRTPNSSMDSNRVPSLESVQRAPLGLRRYLTHPCNTRKTTMRRIDFGLVVGSFSVAVFYEVYRTVMKLDPEDELSCILIQTYLCRGPLQMSTRKHYKAPWACEVSA